MRTKPTLSIVADLRARKSAIRARELAEMLSTTASNLLRKAKRGTIPSYRFGGSVLFDPGATADWLESRAA